VIGEKTRGSKSKVPKSRVTPGFVIAGKRGNHYAYARTQVGGLPERFSKKRGLGMATMKNNQDWGRNWRE